MRFLPRLQQAGYQVKDLPASAAELISTMKKRGRNLGPWVQGDLEKLADEGNPVLIPLSTYQRWFQEKLNEAGRKAVVEKFGPPPGRLMVVKRNGEPHLVIPRIDLGNVILTPQPERGEKQDDKLLHSRDVPPPHNYLAFYWWLEEGFHADASCTGARTALWNCCPAKKRGSQKIAGVTSAWTGWRSWTSGSLTIWVSPRSPVAAPMPRSWITWYRLPWVPD